MSRAYAGVLGFLAFAVTIARGALDGQDAASLVPQACLALVLFALAGAAAGAVADGAVAESVEHAMRAEIEAHKRQTGNDVQSGRME